MTTTTDTPISVTPTVHLPVQVPAVTREPQPVTKAENAKLHRLPRTPRQGPPVPVLARLTLDLDHEQTAWVRATSRQTGLDYITLVLRLIDAARAGRVELDALLDAPAAPATSEKAAAS